ncbi:O-antigen ligase family protein [Sphingomonas sp. Leaf62]|uniref:O-antigen ligase family protein n=1 Tax=Sphingomonas sp. Leaf62 TaxID=1736228 RepID=UPI000A4D2714|nr:O-antigen ligase family protein [Sphingomonas sp. Leaf62]
MFVLWLAGGGSRPDLLGQVVVRVVTFASLVVAILIGLKPSLKATWPVGAILLATLLLLLVQLVPLPQALWMALPGRGDFAFAQGLGGVPQLWRPLAIVPGATVNAFFSLCVPFVILLLISNIKENEHLWLMDLLLFLVVGSMILGIIQFSGAIYNNIFVNDTSGQVSGNFANRNHFALFLSIGCMIAPVWAFGGNGGVRRRGPIALGLILLFVLMILASGSRAGIVTGAMSLLIGSVFVRNGLRRVFSRPPRWIFPALMIGTLAVVMGIVLLSIVADRANSIDRAVALETTSDMRTRGLPVVLHMISLYFPVGAGAGGFDPLFRMHEPFSLLKVTYFNHAHNDYLEIALDTGLPGLILLAVALGWWLITSIRAWRSHDNKLFQPLGSAVLLLVFVASAFDYPARTPLMMAVIAVAAIWLTKAETALRSALPGGAQQL